MIGTNTLAIKNGDTFPRHASVVRARSTKSIIEEELSFQFRKDRGWHWLQKVCLWCLRKIGAFRLQTVETVHFDKLQAQDLHTLIFKSLEAIYKDWWSADVREDLVVCIGSQDWMKLVSDRNFGGMLLNPLAYQAGPFHVYNGLDKRSSLFGVQVAVIPWIEGVVVIPRSAVKNIV